MGEIIDMVTRLKAKQLMNKKLTGREVASILLTDTIQESFGLTKIYTDAETQSAYNSLDGRTQEYTSFNKWMRIEDIIPNLRNMSNTSALSVGYNLNLVLSKIRLFELRWLVDGCENEWKALIDAKRKEVGKYGCKPHVINTFDPLHLRSEEGQIAHDAELIDNLYLSAVRHLKYYMACIALCEIVDEILKVNMRPAAMSCENMLNASLAFFNIAYDDHAFSQHLVESYPGMKPLLPSINIGNIDIADYTPSKESISKVKVRIEDASKTNLVAICAQSIDELVASI